MLCKSTKWKDRVIGFNDWVRNLARGKNCVGLNDFVWIVLRYPLQQETSHPWTRSSSYRMHQTECIQTLTPFHFSSHYVKNTVHQLSPFIVVSFGPVVPRTSLAEHEVLWFEEFPNRVSSQWVHSAWLCIGQNGSGLIPSILGFIIIDIYVL